MSDLEGFGKKAERKIREWLDRPEEGCCLDRLKDGMSGWRGDCNICDFTFYRSPNFYYLESKATTGDNFAYSRLTDYQYKNMLAKSAIEGVRCYVIVLFVSYKRTFILDIKDIAAEEAADRHSINIKKIDKWNIPYIEVETLLSKKGLLDYNPSQIASIF